MATESALRKDRTQPHPLFDGNPAQYWADSKWRADIPRAGAGDVRPRTPGMFTPSDKIPSTYVFGGEKK